MMIKARSYTERTSSIRASLSRVRMHFCTADASGLFLPHLFGKHVMIVSCQTSAFDALLCPRKFCNALFRNMMSDIVSGNTE